MDNTINKGSNRIFKKKTTSKLKNSSQLLWMTVPFFLILIAFAFIPLWGWAIAFVDYIPGLPFTESKFVGMKYFQQLFSAGSEFIPVLRNTLVMSFLGLLCSPIPVILAIMITEVKNSKFKKLVQTVTSFPNFVSWIIVYSIFYSFLSVDDGIINQLLFSKLGWIDKPSDILASADWSWPLMVFAGLWKSAGWSAIIFIAAIAGIDQELYQAAEVDGAGRMRKIWHITVPGIMATFAIIILLSIGNILNTGFDQFYVFHNSMNHETMEVLDTYTYRVGILQLNFSYSTAFGVFKSVISVLLLFTANAVNKAATGKNII